MGPVRQAVVAVVLAVLLLPGVAVAAAPPGAPPGVSVTAGDGTAVVSWVAADDGGDPIYAYTVTTDPGTATVQVPGVAREATLTALANGTSYRVTVRATNHAGTGPPSAVSAPVVPAPPAAAPGPALLREDFTTSAGGMTPVVGGSWAVASGRYTLADPADGGPDTANANLAVHGTAVSGDFVLSTTASATATDSPFNDFSVVFGFVDPADYWFASFSEGNDDRTSGVFRVAGGVRTELADITVPIAAGALYPIRIERTGRAVRVFRSGEQVAALSDVDVPPGRVGFGSRNDGGTFDDLVVTGPALPPGPPPEPPGFLARAWAWLRSLVTDAPPQS